MKIEEFIDADSRKIIPSELLDHWAERNRVKPIPLARRLANGDFKRSLIVNAAIIMIVGVFILCALNVFYHELFRYVLVAVIIMYVAALWYVSGVSYALRLRRFLAELSSLECLCDVFFTGKKPVTMEELRINAETRLNPMSEEWHGHSGLLSRRYFLRLCRLHGIISMDYVRNNPDAPLQSGVVIHGIGDSNFFVDTGSDISPKPQGKKT